MVVTNRCPHFVDDAPTCHLCVVATDEQSGLRIVKLPKSLDQVLETFLFDYSAEESNVRSIR